MADFNKNIKITVDASQVDKSLNDLTKETQQLNKELDKVGLDEKQINSIKEGIENISQSTQNTIDKSKEFKTALVEATVKISQAFVTTAGTILSFTQSEENAAATTAKLGQAMAIADSIEQVYNATKAIGELRTKALELAEAKKTVTTITATAATQGTTIAQQAYTIATNAATFATGLLGKALNALKTAGGWVGILITGLVSLGIYFAATYKSAQDLYDIQVKQNDQAKELFENAQALRKAEAAAKTELIDNDLERTKQANKDQLKELKIFLEASKLAQSALNKELDAARETGGEANIDATKNRINQLKVLVQEANKEITAINRQAFEDTLDANQKAFDAEKDLVISKLNLLKTAKARSKVIELENEKVLNDITTRLLKGEITLQQANNERIKQRVDNTNKVSALSIELFDEEIEKINEVRDLELERLSTVETKTARFAENKINNLKQLDDIQSKLFKSEITEQEAITKNLEAQESLRLSNLEIIKQINEETKGLNDETKKLNLDAAVAKLNKVTDTIKLSNKAALDAIELDAANQLDAIGRLTTFELDAIEEARLKSIEALGKLTDTASDKQKEAFAKNIESINNNAKIKIAIATDTEKIITKVINDEEAKRKQELEDKRLKALSDAIARVADNLVALSEIKLFSDNAGINNFLNSITSAEKALKSFSVAFEKIRSDFKKTVEGETLEQTQQRVKENSALIAEAVGGAAIEITNLINDTVQAAFQANIDSFNAQLDVLAEKKAEIDEDLQNSTDKIKELQGNLAQANIEDRNRVINLIEKERQKEEELQKQKAKAVEDERKIQEKIKEEKKKAFQAQKAAAIISAVINTAISITSALTIPPPAGTILAVLNGALGAAQIAVIASQPTPQFFSGGHTSSGDSRDVAGVVHKNEWVAPAWMTKSPKYKNTIQELESARQGGFATGGFTSDQQTQTQDILNRTINSVELLASRPVFVSVQEINSVYNTVSKARVRSTL